jgi:hypothetical protein
MKARAPAWALVLANSAMTPPTILPNCRRFFIEVSP